MVKQSRVRFEPINDTKKPTVVAPINPPKQFIEPIHEICALVNGPDTNGVFSDDSLLIAGAIQPNIEIKIVIYIFVTFFDSFHSLFTNFPTEWIYNHDQKPFKIRNIYPLCSLGQTL